MRNFLFAIVLSVNTFAMAAPLEKKLQIGFTIKWQPHPGDKKLEKLSSISFDENVNHQSMYPWNPYPHTHPTYPPQNIFPEGSTPRRDVNHSQHKDQNQSNSKLLRDVIYLSNNDFRTKRDYFKNDNIALTNNLFTVRNDTFYDKWTNNSKSRVKKPRIRISKPRKSYRDFDKNRNRILEKISKDQVADKNKNRILEKISKDQDVDKNRNMILKKISENKDVDKNRNRILEKISKDQDVDKTGISEKMSKDTKQARFWGNHASHIGHFIEHIFAPWKAESEDSELQEKEDRDKREKEDWDKREKDRRDQDLIEEERRRKEKEEREKKEKEEKEKEKKNENDEKKNIEEDENEEEEDDISTTTSLPPKPQPCPLTCYPSDGINIEFTDTGYVVNGTYYSCQ